MLTRIVIFEITKYSDDNYNRWRTHEVMSMQYIFSCNVSYFIENYSE